MTHVPVPAIDAVIGAELVVRGYTLQAAQLRLGFTQAGMPVLAAAMIFVSVGRHGIRPE